MLSLQTPQLRKSAWQSWLKHRWGTPLRGVSLASSCMFCTRKTRLASAFQLARWTRYSGFSLVTQLHQRWLPSHKTFSWHVVIMQSGPARYKDTRQRLYKLYHHTSKFFAFTHDWVMQAALTCLTLHIPITFSLLQCAMARRCLTCCPKLGRAFASS